MTTDTPEATAAMAPLPDRSVVPAVIELARNACHGPPGRRPGSRSYSRSPGS